MACLVEVRRPTGKIERCDLLCVFGILALCDDDALAVSQKKRLKLAIVDQVFGRPFHAHVEQEIRRADSLKSDLFRWQALDLSLQVAGKRWFGAIALQHALLPAEIAADKNGRCYHTGPETSICPRGCAVQA